MNPIVGKVLANANSQFKAKVQEHPRGSNGGLEVEAYLRSTGLGKGNPWCAAFVNWCIQEIGKQHNMDIAWPKTASCDVILTFARRHDILFAQPEAGDVFLVMATQSDATHTGFVASVEGGKFRTFEGNSNDEGSREGYEVASNNRPLTSRFRFVRWGNLLPDAAPAGQTFELYFTDWNTPKFADIPVTNGVARVQAADWCKKLGVELGWDSEARCVTIDKRPVAATPLILDGHAFLPVRALAEFSGLNLTVQGQKILVSRPR